MAASGDQSSAGNGDGCSLPASGVTLIGGANGTGAASCGSDRINSFSLVSYIPGALGDFLTRLRQEVVPSCVARSHVTVLPPRPLFIDVLEAEEWLRREIAVFPSFTLEMPKLGKFEDTGVIFVDIGDGRDQLVDMHSALARGPFHFSEPYPYHPHITIAQGVPAPDLLHVYELALRRWEESVYRKSVFIDSLIFVQNTVANRWLDLAECELRGAVAGLAP